VVMYYNIMSVVILGFLALAGWIPHLHLIHSLAAKEEDSILGSCSVLCISGGYAAQSLCGNGAAGKSNIRSRQLWY
jgi:hypothetical protein